MSSIKNGAIIALLCSTASAIALDHQHKQAIKSGGIFGKMIEMATAGDDD